MLAVTAAVVGVGSLVYHNREVIGDVLGKAGQGIATAATWAASRTVEISKAYVDANVKAAKAVVDGVSQAVGAVADEGRKFVEGIIRKPSWAPW